MFHILPLISGDSSAPRPLRHLLAACLQQTWWWLPQARPPPLPDPAARMGGLPSVWVSETRGTGLGLWDINLVLRKENRKLGPPSFVLMGWKCATEGAGPYVLKGLS